MHRSVGSLDWCVQPRLPAESGKVKKGYWWGRAQGRVTAEHRGCERQRGNKEEGGLGEKRDKTVG